MLNLEIKILNNKRIIDFKRENKELFFTKILKIRDFCGIEIHQAKSKNYVLVLKYNDTDFIVFDLNTSVNTYMYHTDRVNIDSLIKSKEIIIKEPTIKNYSGLTLKFEAGEDSQKIQLCAKEYELNIEYFKNGKINLYVLE